MVRPATATEWIREILFAIGLLALIYAAITASSTPALVDVPPAGAARSLRS